MTDSVRPTVPAASTAGAADSAGSLHCPNCGAAAGLDATQCTYCHAPLATMSCPTCFNRVFVGAAYCPHCGTRAARQDEGAAPESCPRCRTKTPMTAVHLGAMSLAECATCAGVWVDADAFDRLCADREAQAAVVHGSALRGSTSTGAAPDAPPKLEKISYRPCPRCKKMMNRVNFAKYSGVVLDVCRAHGTFFDRDELHRVVRFIQAGGLDRARARDREDLVEAERRLRSLQTAAASGAPAAFSSDQSMTGTSAFESFVRLLFHANE
jgi:Zn-finger nucleic acid-binding protein